VGVKAGTDLRPACANDASDVVVGERAGVPGAFFLDTGAIYPRPTSPEPKEMNMSKSDPETPRGPMGDARRDSMPPSTQINQI
jgi:hypothetical protein